ncbi:MAG: hemerythrin domain-containing protein, partial [Bdellovibrionota bacterium]
TSDFGVVTLLLKDHAAMKKLMAAVKSKRSSRAKVFSSFAKLEKLVHSHMTAEEGALLNRIENHEKFAGEAVEGLEEHEIHRIVMKSIHSVRDPLHKAVRMKSYCEILEHHLHEEEVDLFPRFKKYAALSTRKKMGKVFLRSRKKSHSSGEKLGALAKR